ncbi:MAG: GntR family transcriptional regulator [Hyphomicrobiales bacterium]
MQPIKRVSLHEEVLWRTRELVVEGAWRPGDVIPEMEISAALHVSRTPVREALKVLAAEGLVEVSPRQGAIVKFVESREAREILFVTGELEAAAGRLACRHASDAAIRRIAKLHAEMVAAYSEGRRRSYFEANQAIHRAIVEASGNSVLSSLHATLLGRMRRIRYACTNRQESWHDAMVEHELILDALRRRDPDALAAILVAHMAGGWERVKQFVEAEAGRMRQPASRPARKPRAHAGTVGEGAG